MVWSDEHGPDELYDKFEVIRKRTGEPLREFCFVLLPERDEAACAALDAYAQAVRRRSPNLADTLERLTSRIVARERGRLARAAGGTTQGMETQRDETHIEQHGDGDVHVAPAPEPPAPEPETEDQQGDDGGEAA